MDKNCTIVKFSKDHLIIESGPVSIPPVIIPTTLINEEFGSLPPGEYYYAVTAIGVNGESAPVSKLQVHAKHKNNSIRFQWTVTEYVTEYHVYRGTKPNKYDGFYPVYTRTGNFHDNGIEELNKTKTQPPSFTPAPDMWDRKIHREGIKKTNSLFLQGNPNTIHVYLVLLSGEIVTIDINKVMNQPGWHSPQKFGLLRAITEIGEWINAGKS